MSHPVQRLPEATVPWSTRVRPQRVAATLAIVGAGAVGAASLGASITAFPAQFAIEDAMAGASVPDTLPYDSFSILYSVLLVLAWVPTSVWLHRARVNAEAITSLRHERGRAWCWLGWVVPVVSLWFPRQVVRDVHRGSAQGHPSPPRLDLWWGLWLAGVLTGSGADRFALGESLDHVSWLGPLNLLSTALLLGALVLWVRIVTSVVRLQEAAAHHGG